LIEIERKVEVMKKSLNKKEIRERGRDGLRRVQSALARTYKVGG
jgi:hypothetical protein